MNKVYCKGKLPIGNIELDCYVLDDDIHTRILSATSVFSALGRTRKGMNDRLEIAGTKLPPFIASKNLQDYIDNDIIKRVTPLEFIDGNSIKTGYDANLLPDICSIYVKANRDGVLTERQKPLVEQAEILLIAFAKVGIIALVDEATGFQRDRKHDALRIILEKYVEEALQKWVKTFPDEFFTNLDRLYNNEKTISKKRPPYYGKFINEYIYEPIEHGYVKAKLNELNISDDRKRKARFHQWLTKFGKTQLSEQLWKTIGVMEISTNMRQFKERQSRLIQPSLFDEIAED